VSPNEVVADCHADYDAPTILPLPAQIKQRRGGCYIKATANAPVRRAVSACGHRYWARAALWPKFDSIRPLWSGAGSCAE
jgi:hypothetical protein